MRADTGSTFGARGGIATWPSTGCSTRSPLSISSFSVPAARSCETQPSTPDPLGLTGVKSRNALPLAGRSTYGFGETRRSLPSRSDHRKRYDIGSVFTSRTSNLPPPLPRAEKRISGGSVAPSSIRTLNACGMWTSRSTVRGAPLRVRMSSSSFWSTAVDSPASHSFESVSFTLRTPPGESGVPFSTALSASTAAVNADVAPRG